MKGTHINDFIASLPQAEQEAIEDEYQKLHTEYVALQDLRKATGISQEQLADIMETNQGNLSKLERRTDVHVSTLRRYIEALGGRLHIMASLPDKPLVELKTDF